MIEFLAGVALGVSISGTIAAYCYSQWQRMILKHDALRHQIDDEKNILDTALRLSASSGYSLEDATQAIIRVKQQTFQTKQRKAKMRR